MLHLGNAGLLTPRKFSDSKELSVARTSLETGLSLLQPKGKPIATYTAIIENEIMFGIPSPLHGVFLLVLSASRLVQVVEAGAGKL